jgi:hypothetical protein
MEWMIEAPGRASGGAAVAVAVSDDCLAAVRHALADTRHQATIARIDPYTDARIGAAELPALRAALAEGVGRLPATSPHRAALREAIRFVDTAAAAWATVRLVGD